MNVLFYFKRESKKKDSNRTELKKSKIGNYYENKSIEVGRWHQVRLLGQKNRIDSMNDTIGGFYIGHNDKSIVDLDMVPMLGYICI